MNPYQHDEIINAFDVRLVDCFVKQNQGNQWVTLKDVASWVFETNTPSGYHTEYCKNKIVSILGMLWTSEIEKSFLEKGRLGTANCIYVYRLKDPSQIISKDLVEKTVERQVDEAMRSNTEEVNPRNN